MHLFQVLLKNQNKNYLLLILRTTMNFIFQSINDINDQNISFLETRKNSIIEGSFTKIVYNDECITINGIFIYLYNSPFVISTDSLYKNNYISDISWKKCQQGNNFKTIQNYTLNDEVSCEMQKYIHEYKFTDEKEKIYEFENNILNSYKRIFKKNKNICYSLKKQIINNSFKVYSIIGVFIGESNSFSNNVFKSNLLLKVSGIWETANDIGLTFKFFTSFQN